MREHSRERELWRELDKMAFWLSAIGACLLGGFYFLIASLVSGTPREFLLALITELIPVLLLFAVSYTFFRRMQAIRSQLEVEELTESVARRLEAQFERVIGESSKVRQVVREELTQSQATILLLAASPSDLQRLGFEHEIRGIKEGLRGSKGGNAIRVEQEWGVRKSDLQNYFVNYRPRVVHFSCHGSEKGIYLEGEGGISSMVSAKEVQKLLSVFRDTVRLVFMNTMNSSSICELIAEDIAYVIGIDGAVEDEVAIEFATSFYHGIGNGLEVEVAFELGCARVIGTDAQYKLFKPRRGGPENIVTIA